MKTIVASKILAIMNFIAPPQETVYYRRNETMVEITARYEQESQNLAKALNSLPRLFKNDEDGKKSASLVLAIAKFESGLDKEVGNGKKRGDGGRSWCHMQINIGTGNVYWGSEEMRTWKGVDLVSDTTKCWMAGIEAIRLSMTRCSEYGGSDVLSGYTTGKCQKDEKKAYYRWLYMKRIGSKVTW